MNEYEINDKRILNDFKNITFSKYEKKKVKNELFISLQKNLIENSQYWSIELICSAHFYDLWEIILLYFSKYIHISNPKICILIENNFNKFKSLYNSIDNELNLRNNKIIRKIFAEMICLLCISKKNFALENLKIKNNNEFDIVKLSNRFKAPNIEYAKKFFKENDSKEVFIAINEFSYHISNDSLNCISAIFWLEWLLEYQNMCKNKNIILTAEIRNFVNVDKNFNHDIIWIIWESIFYESEKNTLLKKIILSLYNLFCIKFNNSVKKRRKYIIYCAIYYITQNINLSIKIIENKNILYEVIKNIDKIYKKIKDNEVKPDTD